MGADSDWPVMQVAARISDELGVPYEARVVSARRTPELLFDHAERAHERGLAAIVASAGSVVAFPPRRSTAWGPTRNEDAVRRVFALKGRPADHPLIVHLAETAQADVGPPRYRNPRGG